MRSLPPVRNQSRIRCLHVLWRQDFILSGKCKLKTRTHMGKLAPTIQKTPGSESVEDQMPVSLVATRFPSCHRVGEVQVENSHPHGKTCSPRLLWRHDFHLVIASGKCKLKTRTHKRKLAPTWENVQHVLAMAPKRTRFQKADQTAGKRCRNGCVNCKSRG